MATRSVSSGSDGWAHHWLIYYYDGKYYGRRDYYTNVQSSAASYAINAEKYKDMRQWIDKGIAHVNPFNYSAPTPTPQPTPTPTPAPTPSPTPSPEPTPGPSPSPWDGGDSQWDWSGGGGETSTATAGGPGAPLWGASNDGADWFKASTPIANWAGEGQWATAGNTWFISYQQPANAWQPGQTWAGNWNWNEPSLPATTAPAEASRGGTGIWGVLSKLWDFFTS